MLKRLLKAIVGIIVIATLPLGIVLGIIHWIFTGENFLMLIADWIVNDY